MNGLQFGAIFSAYDESLGWLCKLCGKHYLDEMKWAVIDGKCIHGITSTEEIEEFYK